MHFTSAFLVAMVATFTSAQNMTPVWAVMPDDLAPKAIDPVDPDNGQLIVFVRPNQSEVDNTFQEEVLPEVRKIAAEIGTALHVWDSRLGSPEGITITPSIVFENSRGRSVYQGRYRNLDRIRTFIRTSRYVPRGDSLREWSNIPVWTNGRAHLIAPIKVSSLGGTLPEEYCEKLWQQDTRHWVDEGLVKFWNKETYMQGSTDRLFYMDFYPWLGEDGTLHVSASLFSQFHCKKPVFTTGDTPFKGPWKYRRWIFRRAARALEDAVAVTMADPSLGDGFDIVESYMCKFRWAALAMPVPAPAENAPLAVAPKLPTSYRVANSANLPPQVQFAFPAPLDGHRGEAQGVSGTLNIPGLDINKASGIITVDVGRLTMGDSELDAVIRGSLYLDAKTHPKASFAIKSLVAEQPLTYGVQVPTEMSGTFTMKGKPSQLTLPSFLEAVVMENGKPAVILTSGFDVNLNDYGIPPADGPEPENHTLNFDIRTVFAGQ